MNIFEYTDYKKFLTNRLGHGLQKKFAFYLGCQPAFLSQVLRGNPDLSLEQGILATEYFKLNANESEYFMLALQLSRAGTNKLKKYFESKTVHCRSINQRIDSRIGAFETLDEQAKSIFYSSWKYSFIYVSLSIPTSNSIEFIAAKTNLSVAEISKTINELVKMGLVKKSDGEWLLTKKRIHLSSEDSQIKNHHKNFRTFCLRELEEIKSNSFHFSSVVAIPTEDAQKIKEILLKAIEKSEAIIRPSKEESLKVLCIDFFEPGNS
jgi:uncharacterized protein (TIGR02147 family)